MSCLSLSSRRKQRSSFFRIDCDKVEFRRNEDWIFSTPGPRLPFFLSLEKIDASQMGMRKVPSIGKYLAYANSFTRADCST